MEALVPTAAGLFLVTLAAYLATLAFREFATARALRASVDMERLLLGERITEMAERRRRELEKAERTWDGFRKFVVTRKEMEANDICSFYLEPHDRRPLPVFMPGQYLTFRLAIPGQAKPVIRCYSLSDAPKAEYFRVTIKRIGPPPGKPDGLPGLASSYFHEDIEVGNILDVKAPAGQFWLEPADTTPVVLIGGGIGLTPVLSMLQAIVDANARREVWFFYGLRNRTEHVMARHLHRIAAQNPNVSLHVCYSDPTGECQQDVDYQHAERVSVDLMRRVLPSNAPHFYLCGPPPMMQAMVEGLAAWGVPHERIHHEAFGPASVKSAAAATAPAAAVSTPVEVVFSRSARQCVWDGRSTLLEMAEANGIRLDFGCRAGNCGTCITALKTGTVDYPSPPGTAVETGSCLACVAVPKGNVTLDA
ncbi:MAG: 2Fe-2S iron-sulfur cluster binding domain-containing protein [Alphaproteobacteria bacterium]|nr:2Fe-2S iron-sulfur cluster binding domain-containing protein [Alphaproteobacteria bacterium]